MRATGIEGAERRRWGGGGSMGYMSPFLIQSSKRTVRRSLFHRCASLTSYFTTFPDQA